MNTTGNPFHAWIQLEQPRLGTEVTFATDEFFAARERLIQPEEPVFIPNKYDEHGKWMDGWESRRKREPGHDYCVVRLGVPGVSVVGTDFDDPRIQSLRRKAEPMAMPRLARSAAKIFVCPARRWYGSDL